MGMDGQDAATGGAVASSTALGTTQSLVLSMHSRSSGPQFDLLRRNMVVARRQFNFLTRSGTIISTGPHSTILRNSFFDANDWFNDRYGTGTDALRQNDFWGDTRRSGFILRTLRLVARSLLLVSLRRYWADPPRRLASTGA